MASIRPWIALTALTAGIAGCQGSEQEAELTVPARDESPIQTDELEYRLHPELTNTETGIRAVATYTNDRDTAVLYQRCTEDSTGPIFEVIRAEPDSGSHVVGVVWACVGGVAAGIVQPGQTLTFEVPLGSSVEQEAPPIAMQERTGLFRVSVRLFESFDLETEQGVSLPIAERQSNVFKISAPE